jgi:chemotaxis protein MotB
VARQRVKVVQEGTPIGYWMVTFSDMNTLLLTFFVLLFSMSSIRIEQFQQIFATFTGDGLGLLSEGSFERSAGVIFDPIPEIPKKSAVSKLGLLLPKTEERPGEEAKVVGLNQPFIDAQAPDGSISVVMSEDILFQPGSTRLSSQSQQYLDNVVIYLRQVLASTNRRITIEGYDDGSSPHAEPLQISTRRAFAVLEHLLRDGTLPPARFSFVGYGDSKKPKINQLDGYELRNCVRILVGPEEESIFTVGN